MRNPFTLQGLVVPAEWDDDNQVTLVSILTDDEGEYLVLADKAGRELIPCIHSRVQASGHLFRDEHGEQILQVKQFSVLGS
jgi:hypothetical protein